MSNESQEWRHVTVLRHQDYICSKGLAVKAFCHMCHRPSNISLQGAWAAGPRLWPAFQFFKQGAHASKGRWVVWVVNFRTARCGLTLSACMWSRDAIMALHAWTVAGSQLSCAASRHDAAKGAGAEHSKQTYIKWHQMKKGESQTHPFFQPLSFGVRNSCTDCAKPLPVPVEHSNLLGPTHFRNKNLYNWNHVLLLTVRAGTPREMHPCPTIYFGCNDFTTFWHIPPPPLDTETSQPLA